MNEQGWCQDCNKHTKEGSMVESSVNTGQWYFLCPSCGKEYVKK